MKLSDEFWGELKHLLATVSMPLVSHQQVMSLIDQAAQKAMLDHVRSLQKTAPAGEGGIRVGTIKAAAPD